MEDIKLTKGMRSMKCRKWKKLRDNLISSTVKYNKEIGVADVVEYLPKHVQGPGFNPQYYKKTNKKGKKEKKETRI